jgi:DNA-binding NarL/FixJ family response regulator
MVTDRDMTVVLRELMDADPEYGIVLMTPDRRVLYSNVAARSYLRDGTPRGEEALLPESVDRAIEDFVLRAQNQRGPTTAELHYPSDSDRRIRITLEAIRRDQGTYIVLRAQSATPWAEPTVRRLQSRFGLTVREAQVAAGVARGHTNREVAEQLGIVEKTVKNVLMSVFNKCTVKNRVQLALRAYDAPVPHLNANGRI